MGASERGALPKDLAQGRSRFQAWRGRRKAGEPDSAAALGAGRPAGEQAWGQSHRRGARPRLLQLEETGRSGGRPAAVERPGVRRVAVAGRGRQAVSVRAGQRRRGHHARATGGLRRGRCRGPRRAASGTPSDAPDHAADEDPGGRRAGRFSPRHRRPGAALPGNAPARSVRRRGLRLSQSQRRRR